MFSTSGNQLFLTLLFGKEEKDGLRSDQPSRAPRHGLMARGSSEHSWATGKSDSMEGMKVMAQRKLGEEASVSFREQRNVCSR